MGCSEQQARHAKSVRSNMRTQVYYKCCRRIIASVHLEQCSACVYKSSSTRSPIPSRRLLSLHEERRENGSLQIKRPGCPACPHSIDEDKFRGWENISGAASCLERPADLSIYPSTSIYILPLLLLTPPRCSLTLHPGKTSLIASLDPPPYAKARVSTCKQREEEGSNHGPERSGCSTARRPGAAVKGFCGGRKGQLPDLRSVSVLLRVGSTTKADMTGPRCSAKGIVRRPAGSRCKCQAGGFFTDKSQESGMSAGACTSF